MKIESNRIRKQSITLRTLCRKRSTVLRIKYTENDQ